MRILFFILLTARVFGQGIDYASIANLSAAETDRKLGIACKCDFTVTADQVLDGVKMGAKPGQIICFKAGAYSWLYIQNFKGEPGNPITFVNECSGKVVFKRPDDGQRIVWAINNQFVRWTGTGNFSEFYGFEFTGGGQGIDFRDRSTNVEVDHSYFHDIGYSAVNAKTDPVCGKPETQRGGFTMRDIWIHDNWFLNIRTGEGAYVGESHYAAGFKASCGTLQEHDVYGVKFYNNVFENIGRDAIQVGGCLEGMEIYNNRIKNFGQTKEYGQGSGITINPGSKGLVYDNVIDTGSGFGICAQGRGGTKIYRNLIINTGWAKDGGGIMTASYAPIDPAGYEVYNNTLVNINRVGIEYYSPTKYYNNLVNVSAGVVTKKGGSAGVLSLANNIESIGDSNGLALDGAYVPLSTSKVPAGIGYKDYIKPAPKVIQEYGTVEVITTDGVEEWFLITTSGKRLKVK